MKKIYRIIVVIGLFMLFNFNVNAKELYRCGYKYNVTESSASGPGEYTGYFIVTDDYQIQPFLSSGLDSVNWLKNTIGHVDQAYVIDKYLDKDSSDEAIIKNVFDEEKVCPTYVTICRVSTKVTIPILPTLLGTEANYYFIILNARLIREVLFSDRTWVYAGDFMPIFAMNPIIILDENQCFEAEYDESSTGESKDLKFSCPKYEDLIGTLYYSHQSNNAYDYNMTKTQLKQYCKSVLGNTSHIDPCLKDCVDLNNYIMQLEGITSNNYACGFSDNLLGFIKNIMKWVKYLIPAIIIILSILDFIKAIGSDKEDEMKKAQHKFVIRLIVAVLIFIIPFIIEFILDKMGFVAEGCGIIDF